MAITKSIKLVSNFGDEVNFPNAYIRVASVSGDKSVVNTEIFYFNEKKGKFLQKSVVIFTPNMDGKNYIAQAYDYIKTLPEFANAQDC